MTEQDKRILIKLHKSALIISAVAAICFSLFVSTGYFYDKALADEIDLCVKSRNSEPEVLLICQKGKDGLLRNSGDLMWRKDEGYIPIKSKIWLIGLWLMTGLIIGFKKWVIWVQK